VVVISPWASLLPRIEPAPATAKGLASPRVVTKPSFSERGAVVTGANRGIGKAIALAFLRSGWQVLAVARTDASLSTLADEAGADAKALERLACDVADVVQLQNAIARLSARRPVPAVLVNNAGVSLSAPLEKTGRAELEHLLEVNVVAPYLLAAALVPAMAEAGGGRVVNIASIAGLRGIRYTSAYCASKHALVGLTRALAVEWASRGVTVNAVCPGWTETDMLASAVRTVTEKTGRSAEQARSAILARNPLARAVTPKEVAALVLYLASAEAASLTGAALPVDGGESA
jgi:NAD(P)-dependent dehydrogenase (short-subunit alcohol dehydrogenase family)